MKVPFWVRVVGYIAVLLSLRFLEYGLLFSLYGNADPFRPWLAGAAVLTFPVFVGWIIHTIERDRSDSGPQRRKTTMAAFVVLALPFPWELVIVAVLTPGPLFNFD